jgi:hypothetical protein
LIKQSYAGGRAPGVHYLKEEIQDLKKGVVLFTVFSGGAVGILFKIVAEMVGLGKSKEVGDLLDGEGGIEEEGFGFGGSLFGDPGGDGLAGLTFNDVGEIGGVKVLQDGVVAGAKYFF